MEISLFGATVLKIAYGIDVQESDDPYILVGEEAMKGLGEAGIPGAFWVDLFPVLKYVPSWFPGAGFQKKAAHWRAINKAVTQNPFRYVKEQLVGDRFSERSRTCLNDVSAEEWQRYAIHGSKPH